MHNTKQHSSQTVKGKNATGDTKAGGTQSIYELFKNRMNVVKVASSADFTAGTADAPETDYKVISIGQSEDITKKDSAGEVLIATQGSDGASGGGVGAFTPLTANAAWPTNLTMMFFNDGIMFAFDNTQADCHASTAVLGNAYCYGWIDVNGQKGPNKVVQCDNGTLETPSGQEDDVCTVTNPTDIYPVMFFDQSILPASAAARAVLYAK